MYVCMYYIIIYKMYKCIYFKFCRSCLPSSLSRFLLRLPVLFQSRPAPSLCTDVLPHVLQQPLVILPSHVLFFPSLPFLCCPLRCCCYLSKFFLKKYKSIFEIVSKNIHTIFKQSIIITNNP